MKVDFKIPQGMASYLVAQREQRNVYETNRAVKMYAFFALLKTLTSTGTIQQYHKQIEAIATLTKRSKSSVYSYLSLCKKSGLLRIENQNIYLNSWEKIINTIDECIYNPSFTTVQYDTTNEIQTPEYLIYACEVLENQQKQTQAVIKQIEENLPLAQCLNVQQTVTKKHVDALQKLQVFTYVNGKTDTDYELLHSLNADVQRSAKTLRKAFKMKSRRSVKYLKLQLHKRGIATIITNRKHESPNRARVCQDTYYTGYNPDNKNTFWKQPDLIKLNCA